MSPADVAALVREARALIDARADDPRRAQFAARKDALLAEVAPCSCPTHPSGNGDIRCHVCGEYVNKRCWNCRTPRGEGECPTTARLLAEVES